MLPKFSVKKPMTIVVAVVLVIVLGIVAFTNMTPDLLPSIDLPYVIVLTTYPGASPEMVEEELTKPIASSMATLDNIDNVSGTSNENYSLVMLQFADGSSLDTATIDIREKLNLLSDDWDDMVGASTILKINPDMLPVMVAAVDRADTSLADLSSFTEDTLLTQLESVEGVASVSASGMLEETVLVTMDDSLMDALSQRVHDAIDKKFDDALADIQKTRDELTGKSADLEDSRAEVESGRAELANARQTLDKEFADAGTEMDEKRAELQDTKEQLFDAREELLDKQDQLITTQESLLSLQSTLTQLDTSASTLDATISTLSQTQNTITTLENALSAYNFQIAAINAGNATDAEKQAAIAQITSSTDYQQVVGGLAAVDAQLAAQNMTRSDLKAALDKAVSGRQEITAARQKISDQLAAQDMTIADIPKALTDLENGLREITDGLSEIQTNINKLNEGQISIDEAKASLPDKKYDATAQLYEGIAQVEVGAETINAAQSQLDTALQKLDEAEDTIEEQRETAYDQADLSAKINRQTIAALLYAQNFAMPAGYIADGDDQYLVRVGDKLSGVDELTDLTLFDTGDDLIGPVKLSDVARVTVVDNSDELYAKINGREGVLLSFNKQSGYATATVAASISEKFQKLSGEYDGLTFTELMNQGDYIGLVVDSVIQNLLLGAAFAIIILFFFLWDLRPTLIVACSIPISVTFAIVLMYFSGVTLNIISLSGLAVGVGMLVDNSIVVIENIYRMRAEGMTPVRAAVQGAKQVTAAITSSTLTTVCVFFPIVFIQGLTRQLFSDMALTIGYSLLASLLVAVTLVPAMAAGVLRKPTRQSKKQTFRHFQDFYRRTVEWAIRHKAVVLAGALALLVGSGLLVFAKGFTYMPEMSSSQIMVSVETEKGTPLSETASVSDSMVEEILKIKGVDTVGSMLSNGIGSVIGLNTSSNGNTTKLTMYVLLEDGASDIPGITKEIQKILDQYPVDAELTANSSMAGASTILGGSGVSLRVYGDDLQQLQQTSTDLAEILSNVEGCVDAAANIGETTPELRVTVDKDKAAAEGLTVAQIYQALASDLTTEATATKLTADGSGRDVVIVTTLDEALETRVLADYDLTVTGQDGTEKTVKLGSVSDISETQTPSAIHRSSRGRYVEITAGLADGYNVTKVTSAAEKAVAEYTLPSGLSVVFTGENETILSSLSDLGVMLLLGVLIVYLIMVAQFQSLLSPLIVMFTIPLAFTGSFLALLIANMEISIIAMIGLIMLVGIIVNNGIVLVDYTNQLRRAGVGRREAVVEAATTRLRPIFMTAVTTILGLLPLAFGMGMGSSLVQPVAVVCIGGLLYATLMTLYVIPALYDLLARRPLRNVRDEDVDAEIGDDPLLLLARQNGTTAAPAALPSETPVDGGAEGKEPPVQTNL